MVVVTYTWRKNDRPESCDKCNSLKGYTWSFIDEVAYLLIHPSYGPVYDIAADHSLAHGGTPIHCKCWLTYDIDDSDVVADLEEVEGRITRMTTQLEGLSSMFLTVAEAFM